MDRTALSVAGMAIRQEMGLSYGQLGWVLSAFAWGYLVCQIPAGVVADRVNARWFLAMGLVVWSLAQVATGLVQDADSVFLTRLVLGVGEAPLFLVGTIVLTRWFPVERRGMALGVFNASASLGPAMAPPVLVGLEMAFGWRGMFEAVGCVGLVLGAVWALVYREPGGTMGERGTFWDAFWPLLRNRIVWVMFCGYAGVIYLTWLYATWLPSYLQGARHFSLSHAGLLSAVPQVCAFFGSVVGGGWVDRLRRGGWGVVEACRSLLVCSLVLTAGATVLAAFWPGWLGALVWMCVALFGGGVAMTVGWVLGASVAGGERVATFEAIQNTGGSVGGALAPAVTGWLTEGSGSFVPALVVAACVGVATAGLYAVGLKGVEHVAR